MSLSRFWLFLAIALPVLASLLAPMSTVDLAYGLRAGAGIIDTHAIPATDTWTYTVAGQPWLNQQWGAQLLLAGAYGIGSWTGLAILRALLTAVIFGCLVVVGVRRGIAARTVALLSIGAFVVAAPAMALRPQLFGMAAFALVLLLVADRRTHPGRLWLVPIIVAVWANLHGSFFLGPLVVGLAWLEDVHDRIERPHRTLLVALVSAATACLTPFGPAVWAYAVGLSSNSGVTARVSEWQPTTIRSVAGFLFFASALGVVALLARRGRVTPWPTLLWLATFFLIGLYAERGVAWWPLAAFVAVTGLLATPVGATHVAAQGSASIRRANAIVAGVLVIVAIALLPLWRPTDPGTGTPVGVLSAAPSGVTAAIREAARPGDHVFARQTWGSWLEFAMPDLLVGVDSRIELFPSEIWDAYDRVMTGGPGWQEQLAAWKVRIVAVGPEDLDVRDRLRSIGWEVRYEGTDGLVLVSPLPGLAHVGTPARTFGAVTSRTARLDFRI